MKEVYTLDDLASRDFRIGRTIFHRLHHAQEISVVKQVRPRAKDGIGCVAIEKCLRQRVRYVGVLS